MLDDFLSRRARKKAKSRQEGSEGSCQGKNSWESKATDEEEVFSHLTRSAGFQAKLDGQEDSSPTFLERRSLLGKVAPLGSVFKQQFESTFGKLEINEEQPSPAKVQVGISPCILQLSSSEKFDVRANRGEGKRTGGSPLVAST